jgi:hypothetical protein
MSMQNRSFSIIVALVLLILSGCTGTKYTHRYRLTIVVQTPTGIKAGSSVIEASGAKITSINGNGFGTGFVGDAVFLDLGGNRNVVALLTVGTNADTYRFGLLAPLAFGMNGGPDDFIKIQTMTGSLSLTARLIPTLVTFRDISNPQTAEVVAPEAFGSTFGRGFEFLNATVELTTDNITRGITTKMPWLNRMIKQGEGGTITQHHGVFTVNVPYFTRG